LDIKCAEGVVVVKKDLLHSFFVRHGFLNNTEASTKLQAE